VWNRQSIDHPELRHGDKNSRPRGGKPTRGWNPRDQWEISAPGTHPALISDADFLQVQQITALPTPEDGSTDRYQMTGLVICGLCGRRAEGALCPWPGPLPVPARPQERQRRPTRPAQDPLPFETRFRLRGLGILVDQPVEDASAAYPHGGQIRDRCWGHVHCWWELLAAASAGFRCPHR